MKDIAMPVSFNDLLETFEFANFDGVGEHQAYLCRRSGKFYWHSDALEADDLDGPLPDDIDNKEKYLPIPDKRDLDLGKPLVLAFSRLVLPNDFDEVRRMFSRRGAYASFRNLLARRRAVDQRHDFERKATERALREWCKLNDIELTD